MSQEGSSMIAPTVKYVSQAHSLYAQLKQPPAVGVKLNKILATEYTRTAKE